MPVIEIDRIIAHRRVVPAPPGRNVNGPCWEWTGANNGYGYGVLCLFGRKEYIHRFSLHAVGITIPPKWVADHICENTLCFNPEHLEAVTHRENLLRSSKVGAKSHCRNGHERTPENTYISRQGVVMCRPCRRRNQRALNARRREENRA